MGGGLYSVSYKCVDVVKSHNDSAVTIQKNSTCSTRVFPSLLVLPTEERQRHNLHHQWWQEMKWDWVVQVCVYVFRGKWKQWLFCLLS